MRVVFLKLSHQIGRIDFDGQRMSAAPAQLEDNVFREPVYDAQGKKIDRVKDPVAWMKALPLNYRSPYFCAVLKDKKLV